MSAEFGYWEQMESLRRQMEQEERQAVDTAEAVLRADAERKQELTARAKTHLVNIFEAVRTNHPNIKNAPQSEIDNPEEEEYNWVSLSWGNKLYADGKDLATAGVFKNMSPDISEEMIPDRMVFSDHYSIEALVTPAEVGIVHKWTQTSRGTVAMADWHSLTDFVENPAIVFPSVVRALREPQYIYSEKVKGVDYWVDPSGQ